MHFGIIANPGKQNVSEVLPPLFNWLVEQDVEFTVADDLKDLICLDGYNTLPPDRINEIADVVLSFGGDGTFLQTARWVAPKGIPIVGVNMGGFGYLAEVPVEQLRERIIDLINGRYSVQSRMMLETFTEDNPNDKYIGLNDVVVDKGAFPRAIRLETTLDETFINTFTADGLIVSTPTGSTGYSLSAGGPILEPSVDGMIINPICPHTLAHRPLVVCGHRTVKVKAISEVGEFMVAVDGQEELILKSGKEITIQPADCVTRVVIFQEHSFYSLLRNKLQWRTQHKTD